MTDTPVERQAAPENTTPIMDTFLARFLGMALLGAMLLGTVFYAFATVAMP